MTMPAARVADNHVSPMVVGVVPCVGGPIVTPVPTVLIGMMPATTATAMAVCIGPPDMVVKGSMTCLTGGKPQARALDSCAQGGMIVAGCPTVLVGG